MNFVCLLLILGAANPTSKLVFDKLEHDFGDVTRGNKVTVPFTFTNKGDAPLIIIEVKTSCGCTTVIPEKKQYGPGEKGELKVKFDSESFHGPTHKSLTVISNDEKNPELLLEIKANVVEDLLLEPAQLLFSNARLGKESKLELKISTNRIPKLEIKNLQAGPEWLTAELKRVDDQHFKVTLTAHGDKFPEGQNRPRGFLQFETNSENQREVSVSVAATVELPILATPNFVLLWASKKGESRKVEIKLTTPDQTPFKVVDTLFEQKFFSARLIKDEPGDKILEITLADNVDPCQFRDQLRIFTDRNDYPQILIPVRGSVVP